MLSLRANNEAKHSSSRALDSIYFIFLSSEYDFDGSFTGNEKYRGIGIAYAYEPEYSIEELAELKH